MADCSNGTKIALGGCFGHCPKCKCRFSSGLCWGPPCQCLEMTPLDPEKLMLLVFSLKESSLLRIKDFGRGTLKDVKKIASEYGVDFSVNTRDITTLKECVNLMVEQRRKQPGWFNPPPPPSLYPVPGQKATRKVEFQDVVNYIIQEKDISSVDSIVRLCELKLKDLRRQIY